MENFQKYIWLTDTHFNRVYPWTFAKFILNIRKQNPKGIFLTGDISNGITLSFYLKILANSIECPIYFVLGNHDYYFHSIEEQHEKIRSLCKEYDNLIWMTDQDVVPLNDEIALIGSEGWYDARLGNPQYLKYTFDWMLIDDFKSLPSIDDRIQAFRNLADKSTNDIVAKLEKAFKQKYNTVYIITHFPCWKEATRDEGTILEPLFLPYNVNLNLGKMIEELMKDKKKKNIEVFCGHSHTPEYIRVDRNIRCQVGAPNLKFHIIYA